MLSELQVLIMTAISIACLHTLTGPDHYLPFIALSRARGWSAGKTAWWTLVCGSGHVLSSVLLGLGGAALGWSLSKLTWAEGIRGGLAGWVMLIFGFCYACWGIYAAAGNRAHKHVEFADENEAYVYEHRDSGGVLPGEKYKLTPWVLFVIFILGPCEPMIPLLFYPAAENNLLGMSVLIVVYLVVTLVTMLAMVLMGYYGFALFNVKKLEKYVHALGGFTIFICGAGILWMGW
ncbi:MAG: hypothetical protein V4725_00935 [Bacteroidota bacterium]